MKLSLKNIRKNLKPNQVGITKDFLEFLQDNAPINKDLVFVFQDKRNESITTGSESNGRIAVFCKSRILIDILRTISHEWIHALQSSDPTKINQSEIDSEAEANTISAYLLRKFCKENPENETELYKD